MSAKEERPLPNEWEIVQLGQLCDIQGGYAFKSKEYQSSGIPLLRISNIYNGGVSFDEKRPLLMIHWHLSSQIIS